jgi:CRISPR-associated endonuclease Csn1
MRIKYRLGIDLGANSLGWCVYALDENGAPTSIVRAGARIFADGRDPKSLASTAATRRQARQARRRRDRMLRRRKRFMEGLIRFGLMPATLKERKALQGDDPYELRARGLDTALQPYEFGRALFHLCRKRGFKSSRKDSKTPADETGKVKTAIAVLAKRIHDAGCRTVGEYLAKEHAERRPIKGRRSADGSYVLYMQREMVAQEFDLLWEAQNKFHPTVLTDEARDFLRDTLLFQRKLLPVQPGRCVFEIEEPRARLCSPMQQKFRIYQELNNLRLTSGAETRGLTLEERNKLYFFLRKRVKATFAALRSELGFSRSSGIQFNLESEKRKDLKGDIVGAQFSSESCIGDDWFEWEPARQERLARLVAETDEVSVLEQTLTGGEWKFSPIVATALAQCSLPDDFGSLSLKALNKIVPELEKEVVTYDVAVQRAGYQHHSQLHTGELYRALPYYGEILTGYTSPTPRATDADERAFGRIANPTVHIGLNQVRLLLNALVKKYGHPSSIVIELTREFGSGADRRREILRTQAENEDRNRRADERLAALGVRVSRLNRQKLQLYDELGKENALSRSCVYTGVGINMATLFSDEIEVDHVLPFSRSLHDGIGNKMLCTRQANRDKGNRTPFEAFGHSPGRYDWEAILGRAAAIPRREGQRPKALLFREEALDSLLDGKEFLDRHLTDTAYLSRVAKQYLSYICHKDEVWVSTGRLTAMIRGRFGLNSLLSGNTEKNRNDHRHHALDAAVIGLCSRSLIRRIATAAERAEARGANRLLEELELPWPTFREDLDRTLSKIIVSHRPDHCPQTALHNDTNYGLRFEAVGSGNPTVARRVPLETLKRKDIEAFPDPNFRQKLLSVLGNATSDKDVKAALVAFSISTGVRRIVKQESLSVIPIKDRRTGEPYRYVKGDSNYCYEIFVDASGKWSGEVIDSFTANQLSYRESPTLSQSGKPLALRLRKNDLIVIERDGRREVMRVALFTPGIISLVPPNEANVDARNRDKGSGFSYLRKSPGPLRSLRARHAGVDVLGYLNDPGFREAD